MIGALDSKDMTAFKAASDRFMKLLHNQDRLLSTRPEFSVATWINDARALSPTEADRDNMESNARHLITTWGPRVASEDGGLRDYAHREWAGLLNDFYAPRWQTWIDAMLRGDETPIDYYALDEKWVKARNDYKVRTDADCVDTALAVLAEL